MGQAPGRRSHASERRLHRAPFTVNRQYAEASGGDWVILSAKYGFLRPTDVIPGPYEVTFKRRRSQATIQEERARGTAATERLRLA
jgi:hypothetical protein